MEARTKAALIQSGHHPCQRPRVGRGSSSLAMPPRRALASGNRGEKASGSSSSSSSFPKPSALVSGLVVSYNDNENSSSSSTTTHVVDITTCGFRGAELTEPTQGVWMALWDSRENCCLVQCAVPKTFAFDRGTTERVHVSCPSLNEDVVRVWIAPRGEPGSRDRENRVEHVSVRGGGAAWREAGERRRGAKGLRRRGGREEKGGVRHRGRGGLRGHQARRPRGQRGAGGGGLRRRRGRPRTCGCRPLCRGRRRRAGVPLLLSKSVSSIGLGDPEEPGGEAERETTRGRGSPGPPPPPPPRRSPSSRARGWRWWPRWRTRS